MAWVAAAAVVPTFSIGAMVLLFSRNSRVGGGEEQNVNAASINWSDGARRHPPLPPGGVLMEGVSVLPTRKETHFFSFEEIFSVTMRSKCAEKSILEESQDILSLCQYASEFTVETKTFQDVKREKQQKHEEFVKQALPFTQILATETHREKSATEILLESQKETRTRELEGGSTGRGGGGLSTKIKAPDIFTIFSLPEPNIALMKDILLGSSGGAGGGKRVSGGSGNHQHGFGTVHNLAFSPTRQAPNSPVSLSVSLGIAYIDPMNPEGGVRADIRSFLVTAKSVTTQSTTGYGGGDGRNYTDDEKQEISERLIRMVDPYGRYNLLPPTEGGGH